LQFKLAILTVLATRPDGRATLDELKGEVEALTANEDEPEESSSALDEIDIFQSGLVTPEDGGFRITDIGRSALKALVGSSEPTFDFPSAPNSQSLKSIDDVIGTEERLKIFDLDLRKPGEGIDFSPIGEEVESAISDEGEEISAANLTPDVSEHLAPPIAEDPALPESIASLLLCERDDVDLQSHESIPINSPAPPPPDAPAFLVRGFGSGVRAGGRRSSRREAFFGLISRRLSQMRGVWRRHLEQDVSRAKSGRRTGNVGGGAIALLSLLVIIICAGAVLALTQIKSLKSEIATLQRELSPLKARIAKVDSDDKAKRDANQQKESQIKSGVEKNRIGPDPGSDQAALNLTSEEVRLIRDFIKPAPVTGTPAPAINVGDMVSFATIPLPSPLMEKIPKLLGARFATRNGSIIILRRDSRQADVVLPPS
jgi:hypothetical protein